MHKKKVWLVTVLALVPWLSGCSQTSESVPASLVTPMTDARDGMEATIQPPPIEATENESEISGDAEARMQRCHGELQALQKVDGKRYAERKVEFDRLMAGASLYAGIRGAVQSRTQDAVDALYRYRTDKLCADIGQDVLNGLARMGSVGRTL
ncbi:TPA: hypothetical protein ACX37D_004877 [Serratia marcescens]